MNDANQLIPHFFYFSICSSKPKQNVLEFSSEAEEVSGRETERWGREQPSFVAGANESNPEERREQWWRIPTFWELYDRSFKVGN